MRFILPGTRFNQSYGGAIKEESFEVAKLSMGACTVPGRHVVNMEGEIGKRKCLLLSSIFVKIEAFLTYVLP